jgi:hypothetical protein
MFGLSFKEKTAEALHRGTKAALSGVIFHPTQAQKFGFNEEATFWLYSEALAHQIYMLCMLYKHTTPQHKYKWATPHFSINNISKVLIAYELKVGLAPSSTSSFIFERCCEIDELSPKEREIGMHYLQSAKLIVEKDTTANKEIIVQTLKHIASTYVVEARGMFGK